MIPPTTQMYSPYNHISWCHEHAPPQLHKTPSEFLNNIRDYSVPRADRLQTDLSISTSQLTQQNISSLCRSAYFCSLCNLVHVGALFLLSCLLSLCLLLFDNSSLYIIPTKRPQYIELMQQYHVAMTGEQNLNQAKNHHF